MTEREGLQRERSGPRTRSRIAVLIAFLALLAAAAVFFGGSGVDLERSANGFPPTVGEDEVASPGASGQVDHGPATADILLFHDFRQGLSSGLRVSDHRAVEWAPDGLVFHHPATIRLTRSVIDPAFVSESGGGALEVWLEVKEEARSGPESYSIEFGRAFTLTFSVPGVEDPNVSGVVTVGSGEPHDERLAASRGEFVEGWNHIVLSYSDDGVGRLSVNGETVAEGELPNAAEIGEVHGGLTLRSDPSGVSDPQVLIRMLAWHAAELSETEIDRYWMFGPDRDVDDIDAADENYFAVEQLDFGTPYPIAHPMCSYDGAGTMADRVSRNGMSVTFADSHPCGRYANGDIWIVGPVDVIGIEPPSTSPDGWNGAMINPSPMDGSTTGYGPIRATEYEPELNVALDVTPDRPLRVPVGSSLVTTVSVGDSGARPGIDSAAVFTIVRSPPPEGSFRPPYSGRNKDSRFTIEDLRFHELPALEPVEGTPDIEVLASDFENVWLDHVPGWRGRKIHPVTSMPDYGRDLTAALGRGYLSLMLDVSEQEKQELLINLVQIGIDFFGIVTEGGDWPPDGGHASGRKWPILFAGVVLDDRAMATIGERDDVLFGEDAQTFVISQEDVDRGVGYTSDDLGRAEWGIRHATEPDRDDPDWGAPYRRDSTANSWGAQVLAARLMGLQSQWGHDPLFEYVDLYLEREQEGSWERFWDRPFTEEMWDTYSAGPRQQ